MNLMRHMSILTLVTVLCIGPSACSQGIAWIGMLVTYVPEAGLIEGLSQTFDGEHPCPLCQSIKAHDDNDAEEARHHEKRNDVFQNHRHGRLQFSPNFFRKSIACAPDHLQTQCDLALDTPPPIRS